ncbi:hypothetical protein JCM33374_g72 [Metschnikowia sp. JCM 33374]|nr:hypothetical protein JCM33374_g72 [Metschnikowia sp. JCM 33374]
MSFAFGFTGDDISDTEAPEVSVNTPQNPKSDQLSDHAVLQPKFHSLDDLLHSLKNVRLTFDNYQTPNGNIVYRRQLFDIKHQVMTEEDEVSNEVHNILIGNTSDEVDVRKNVYEGGFKSWECSYDLVDKLHTLYKEGELSQFRCLLELGCGTALPTCYLLMLLFGSPEKDSSASSNNSPPQENSPSTFIFSDFNFEVLRLVTLPNILIHYASTLSPETLNALMDSEVPLNNDELLLTPALLNQFTSHLKQRNLELRFISGSWGTDFLSLVSPYAPDLVVTSETIYSPESLPLISSMLIQLFAGKNLYLGLVAAKQYYFGVGGSIKEFLDHLNSNKPGSMTVSTTSDDLGQLKRDIVQLRPST